VTVSRYAGKPAEPGMLVDVSALVAAYASDRPDPSVAEERVAFGTSGHRGSALRAKLGTLYGGQTGKTSPANADARRCHGGLRRGSLSVTDREGYWRERGSVVDAEVSNERDRVAVGISWTFDGRAMDVPRTSRDCVVPVKGRL
jgi:hypothetical protein